MYHDIESDIKQTRDILNKIKTFKDANKNKIINLITKKDYSSNKNKINSIQKQVNSILDSLQINFDDLNAIKIDKALEIYNLRAIAINQKNKIKIKLNTIEKNLNFDKKYKKESFKKLEEFFYNINIKKLSEIEHFHNKVYQFISNEIHNEKEQLTHQIIDIDNDINNYNTQLNILLDKNNFNDIITSQLMDNLTKINDYKQSNKFFEEFTSLNNKNKEFSKILNDKRSRILEDIQHKINSKMSELNSFINDPNHRDPTINFNNKSYVFNTVDDTGTGIAFKSVVLFDLAILSLTNLPVLAHDSPILKHISDATIEQILFLYTQNSNDKQIFIAFDKKTSYTKETQQIIVDNTIIKLDDNGTELFGKSWG